MGETYIRVRAKRTYLYRAVDRDGQTLDFMLSENRDAAAARRFFKRSVGTNGIPERIIIDKNGANLAGLQCLDVILKFTGIGGTIGIMQSKYLNNIIGQDHRFIKRLTRPMLGFKAFHSAAATLLDSSSNTQYAQEEKLCDKNQKTICTIQPVFILSLSFTIKCLTARSIYLLIVRYKN